VITYEEIKEGNKLKILTKSDNIIIGYSEILIALDCVDIIDVEVNSDFRRQGIGKELCKRIIDFCETNGVKTITLEVRKSNIPAQNLYANLGFRIISEREKYYNDGEDAVIMQQNIRNI